jgi:O-antigen/teichoic acid export membrane protein
MIKYLLKSEIGKGSIILIILTALANIFSYLFQFSMARLLGPADYSILAVITATIAIFGIPGLSIQTVVAKNTAKLMAKKEISKIKGLFLYVSKYSLLISLIGFFIFIFVSIFLSNSLKIDFSIFLLAGFFIFVALLFPIGTGILQGTKSFGVMGSSVLINTLLKFSVGVFLVLVGWGVYGATIGFIVGMGIAFLFILPFIKKILISKGSEMKVEIFSRSNLIDFFAIIVIVLFYSIDVFFARAFFAEAVAGQYAVASMIGKIVLFTTLSIGNVMLPINSERKVKGNKKSVFKKALLLTGTVCALFLIVLLIFPKLVVSILFGSQYVGIYPILFYVGASFVCISLWYLITLNTISKDRFSLKKGCMLLIFLLLQMAIFSYFNKSVTQFSLGFLGISFISLVGGILMDLK